MNRKRRGRGEGGIRFRADKGLWVTEVRTAGGKRRLAYASTKKEAQERLRKLQTDIAASIGADAATLTMASYLTRWLEHIKSTVEPATHCQYSGHVRLHLAPHIGRIKLATLHKSNVRGLYATLAAAGMSAALQKKVGTTLTIALNAAVDDDLIPANPASRIKKPKAAKPEIKPLDPSQAAAFLKAARADRLSAFYQTALDTGCRPGELFALEWDDVNLDGQYITITKSLEANVLGTRISR